MNYLGIKESADKLGVHQNTIRNWIASGRLKAHVGPNSIRALDAADIDKLAHGEKLRLRSLPIVERLDPIEPADPILEALRSARWEVEAARRRLARELLQRDTMLATYAKRVPHKDLARAAGISLARLATIIKGIELKGG